MNRARFLVGAGSAIGGLALGRLPALPPEPAAFVPAAGAALNPVYSGRFILSNAHVEINGVDLSDRVRSIAWDPAETKLSLLHDFAGRSTSDRLLPLGEPKR